MRGINISSSPASSAGGSFKTLTLMTKLACLVTTTVLTGCPLSERSRSTRYTAFVLMCKQWGGSPCGVWWATTSRTAVVRGDSGASFRRSAAKQRLDSPWTRSRRMPLYSSDLFVRRGKDTTRQTGFRIAQNGGRKHEIYHVFLLRGSREKVICEFTPFFRPGTVANCVDKVGVIGVFGVTSRWWKLIDTVRRIEYKSTICGW